MTFHSLLFPEVLLIHRPTFPDERGQFRVQFHEGEFRAAGLPHTFVQDNVSISHPGVVRGLHFDGAFRQGKLVSVVSGAILDVVVDVRPASPTRGQYLSVELRGEDGRMVWIPPGFAHGFAVVGEGPAVVLYKVDQVWDPTTDDGLLYRDPHLAIPWPVTTPILSPRDATLPTWVQRFGKPPPNS